jgi:hypothetical protein
MILFEPQESLNRAIIKYKNNRAHYSLTLLIDVLTENNDMSYVEALEYIDYNMQNQGFADWPIIEDEDSITEEDSEE